MMYDIQNAPMNSNTSSHMESLWMQKQSPSQKFPLIQSSSKNLVKLYMNDVGLLTYLLYQKNINAILDDAPGVNLGAVYETVVAQELKAHNHELDYYDRKKLGKSTI